MKDIHESKCESKKQTTDTGGDVSVYKVQMYVKCTEDDAILLRKSLAQSVFDDFELDGHNSVFGVMVVLDEQS